MLALEYLREPVLRMEARLRLELLLLSQFQVTLSMDPRLWLEATRTNDPRLVGQVVGVAADWDVGVAEAELAA